MLLNWAIFIRLIPRLSLSLHCNFFLCLKWSIYFSNFFSQFDLHAFVSFCISFSQAKGFKNTIWNSVTILRFFLFLFFCHQCFCWHCIFDLQPLLFYCHSIIWSVQLVMAQEIHWQTAVFMCCLYLIIIISVLWVMSPWQTEVMTVPLQILSPKEKHTSLTILTAKP